MPTGIGVTFDLEQVDRVIANLEQFGRDATFLMQEIGVELVQGARRRLGGTTGPNGQAWPGLNPGYAAIRAELYPAAQGMLLARGTLSRSLTFVAGPAEVRAGSPLIYAGVHQTGMKIVGRNRSQLSFPMMGASGQVFYGHVTSVTIPARPYLGIGAAEYAGVQRAFSKAMTLLFRV